MRSAVYEFVKDTTMGYEDKPEQPNSEDFQWVTVSKSPCHLASRRHVGVANWLHFCEFQAIRGRFKMDQLCYSETKLLQKCIRKQKHLYCTGKGFNLRK